jgi:hypothetical protein
MKPNSIEKEIANSLPKWDMRNPLSAAIITAILPRTDSQEKRVVCFDIDSKIEVTDEWMEANAPMAGRMLVINSDLTVRVLDDQLFHSIYQPHDTPIDVKDDLQSGATDSSELTTVRGEYAELALILKGHDHPENIANLKHTIERCNHLEAGCVNLSGAIDRIDYACGEPNEMEVSDYAVHQNDEAVIERVKAVVAERKQLSKWKGEAITVMDGWSKLEGLVRDHKDVIMGADISETAIRFINERDEVKAENRHLFAWQTAILGSFDPSCNVTKELSSVTGRTFTESNSKPEVHDPVEISTDRHPDAP